MDPIALEGGQKNQYTAKGVKKIMNGTNTTTNMTAREIVCGGCASSIKKALANVAGVSGVEVDVASKRVTVEHSDAVSRESIVEALDRAGYSAVDRPSFDR